MKSMIVTELRRNSMVIVLIAVGTIALSLAVLGNTFSWIAIKSRRE